jgi:hypothetical protein
MLIHKRPLFFSVTLDANRVAGGHGPDLADGGRAVDIVAVAALDEAFVYPVVIRFGKVGLGVCMTSVAQTGLCLNEQVFRFFSVMRGVAVQAPNIVARMCRRGEVTLLMTLTVATQAAGVGVLLRYRLEANDLGYIPAALHMRRSGTVTGFAAVTVVKRRLEVRRFFEVIFVQVFVTGLASVNTNVLPCLFRGRRNVLFLLSLLAGSNGGLNQQQQDRRPSRLPKCLPYSSVLHGGPHFATGLRLSRSLFLEI